MIESYLKYAIKRKEFVLYYQPQFAFDSEKLIGVEALVRWNHPEEGLLGPGAFMPIAERSALIKDMKVGSSERAVIKQGYGMLKAISLANWH